MTYKVLLLPGDGIGPEIMRQAEKVFAALSAGGGPVIECGHGLLGGAAYEATGEPLPQATLAAARASQAVLLAAIGGPRWDTLERHLRPERGLLGLRSALGLYANLRPVVLYPQLAHASSLREDVISGLDMLIVRELTGDIYFGEPRGVRTLEGGERQGYNTMVYSESEVRRIARVAFDVARGRARRVCSVDKANVLEASGLWREVVTEVGRDYPDVELSHMYVDNAAMQLVRAPKQFDVLVTGNLFGDILSDLASMSTGSIGMLPSAALRGDGFGLYEPIHGSAPDIAGRGIANPLATILSAAMLLRHSLGEPDAAARIERAVVAVLDAGLRTGDIRSEGTRVVGTDEMGDAVVAALARA